MLRPHLSPSRTIRVNRLMELPLTEFSPPVGHLKHSTLTPKCWLKPDKTPKWRPFFDSEIVIMLQFYPMKIAVTGKGGVGKTTVSAVLCHLFASEGKKVLAVDADPDANLAAAFGLSEDEVKKVRPIAEMTELIEERTGARPGTSGGIFKLNPRVDDIAESVGLSIGNITLVTTGRSKEAASGCYCPENVLLRRFLKHLVSERDEAVVIDMEAGIEHLTRGTAAAVDAFIVVVEPGRRSLQTAETIKKMAEGLGVKKVFTVANKVRSDEDVEYIKKGTGGTTFAGAIGFDPRVVEADMKGTAPFDASERLLEEVRAIREVIGDDIDG